MKTITFFISFTLLLANASISQNYVSTEPANKNAILEEFTGVQCPNCPAGHQVMANILASNPGRAFCVAYHPSNSSYTSPYPGDPDFRRTYPNAFYTVPYCGSSRFMPSAFINRREWNGEKIQSRTVWSAYSTTIMGEPSPLNVGMSSSYDDQTGMLYVTVEIYFTETVTEFLRLYVTLSENNLVSQQSGGTASYVHKHTFREAFVAQWGDPLTGTTNQGDLVVMDFEFDCSSTGYIMDNCELLAFVVDYVGEEVISGVGVDVGESTIIPPTADFSAEDTTVNMGTSVQFTDQSMGAPTEWEWTFDGGDPASSALQNPPPVFYNSVGNYSVTLMVSNDAGQSTTTKTDYIEVGFAPETDFEADMTTILEGESVYFTDLSANDPTEWSWIFEGGDPPVSLDQQPPAIVYDIPGVYDVTLVTANVFGEDSITREDYISVGGVGIEEHDLPFALAYPNPTSGNVIIDFMGSGKGCSVSLVNVEGKLIRSIPVTSSKVKRLILDISREPDGLYYIILKNLTFKEVMKVIKQ